MASCPKQIAVLRVTENEPDTERVGVSSRQQETQTPHLVSLAQGMGREERVAGHRLKRKVEGRLLGMALLMLMFNYLDRVSVPSTPYTETLG